MKLDAVDPPLLVGHGGHGTVVRAGDRFKAFGAGRDLPGMAHPAEGRGFHSREHGGGFLHLYYNAAVFPFLCLFDPAAQQMGRELHAVADAEHRNTQSVKLRVDNRRVFIMDGGGTAGKDDADGLLFPDFLHRDAPGDHFRIDVAFPDTAGDQLGILAAEIKDQYFLGGGHVWPP